MTVRPGDTVKLYGHGYTSTCSDTGEDDAIVPLEAVSLVLRLPGGSRVQLGEFKPQVEDTDAGFSVAVAVPADALAGTATVVDDRSPATTYRFAIEK